MKDLPVNDLSAENAEIEKIVQESLDHQGDDGHRRKGQLLFLAYGDSIPDEDCMAGGKRWLRLANGEGEENNYKFPLGHRLILSNKSGQIADDILNHTRSDLNGVPWHIVSLTPGGDFARQDGLFINAFHQAAQAKGEAVSAVTIADGNASFVKNGLDHIRANFFQPELGIFSSGHNIYTTPLGSIHSPEIANKKRRTVVVWAGGTVGNVGLKEGETGFPDQAFINLLHQQVDHTAEECYLVVLHNAFNHPDVINYYSGIENDKFVLSALHEIKRRLPTENFDPLNFECRRRYLQDVEAVEHAIYPLSDEFVRIGEKGYQLRVGRPAMIAGYSAQISRDRMGNTSTAGSFTQVTSIGAPTNGDTRAEVISTTLKVTPPLMDKLRQERGYIPSIV